MALTRPPHTHARWRTDVLLQLVPLAWPLGFAYGLWRRRHTLWQSRPQLPGLPSRTAVKNIGAMLLAVTVVGVCGYALFMLFATALGGHYAGS